MLDTIDNALEPMFKGMPAISKNFKDWLVKYLPVIAIVLGILQLIAALFLWQEGHNYINALNAGTAYDRYYGITPDYHLSFFFWLAQIMVIVDAIILLAAYSKLNARLKNGWKLLFLASLANVVYGIFRALDGGTYSVWKLLYSVVVSVIVLYFLYQVKSFYIKNSEPKALK